jgi:2-oxoglutarate ferredoxin oxidoreductase subunit delta
VTKKFVNENTLVIFDSSFVDDEFLQELQGVSKKYLSIPAKKLAQEKFDVKVTNVILLGAIYKELSEIPKDVILSEMSKKFANHPEFQEQNNLAFEEGLKYATEKPEQQFKGLEKVEVKTVFEYDQKTWQRFPEYCKGCTLCAVRCPQKAISMGKDLNFLGTTMPEVDLEKCTACSLCQLTCPDGALKVSKK